MAEAEPTNKRGKPVHGTRGPLSNVAEEGELCIVSGHSLGRYSNSSMRYGPHRACVRCVAAAREGQMSLSLDKLLKKERHRALRFWSQVDIGDTDECWNWRGYINPNSKSPQFAWKRERIASTSQHHPQRVAMWLTWGDLGLVGVKTTCGNRYCCNPFHLIPQKVGVFVDHDSYLESFETQAELMTLKQQVHDYIYERAIKEQQSRTEANSKDFQERMALMLDSEAGLAERMAAAMADMLNGDHVSLIDDGGTLLNSLFDETDNDEADDSPHDY